jgi:DNA mismatch repair ATPase MutS
MSGLESLFNDLARIRPSEIILSEKFKVRKDHLIWRQLNREKYAFAYESVKSFDTVIPQPWQSDLQYKDGIEEVFSGIELQASAALHKYISKNLIERFPKIQPPIRINPEDTMIIDEAALRSLEIITSIRNNSKLGSLIHAIERTKTRSGTRALNQWLRKHRKILRLIILQTAALIYEKLNSFYLLGFPTTSLSKINDRLDIVEYFYRNTHLTSDIRQILQEVDDAQRTSQKISFDYCGPDDFLKLKRTFEAMRMIKTRLQEELKLIPNLSLEALVDRLKPQDDLVRIITEAIDEDALVRDKETSIKPEIKEDIDLITELPNGENKNMKLDNEEKKISTKNSTKKKRNTKKKDDKDFFIKFEVQNLIKADNWIIKKRYSHVISI